MPATPAPLLVNGIHVDPTLLTARPLRRCYWGECDSHCCGGGVYISTAQAALVLDNQELIKPHLPEARRDPTRWFDNDHTPDTDHPGGGDTISTAVLDDPTHPSGTCCIFLLPDRRCALQSAAIAGGEDPWHFKPFYCALHPLVFDRHVLRLADESEMYLEGGSCNRADDTVNIPLYQLFDVEVKLALGEAGYAELERLALTKP